MSDEIMKPARRVEANFGVFTQAVQTLHAAVQQSLSFEELIAALTSQEFPNPFYDESLSVHLYKLQNALEDGLAEAFGSPIMQIDDGEGDGEGWETGEETDF